MATSIDSRMSSYKANQFSANDGGTGSGSGGNAAVDGKTNVFQRRALSPYQRMREALYRAEHTDSDPKFPLLREQMQSLYTEGLGYMRDGNEASAQGDTARANYYYGLAEKRFRSFVRLTGGPVERAVPGDAGERPAFVQMEKSRAAAEIAHHDPKNPENRDKHIQIYREGQGYRRDANAALNEGNYAMADHYAELSKARFDQYASLCTAPVGTTGTGTAGTGPDPESSAGTGSAGTGTPAGFPPGVTHPSTEEQADASKEKMTESFHAAERAEADPVNPEARDKHMGLYNEGLGYKRDAETAYKKGDYTWADYYNKLAQNRFDSFTDKCGGHVERPGVPGGTGGENSPMRQQAYASRKEMQKSRSAAQSAHHDPENPENRDKSIQIYFEGNGYLRDSNEAWNRGDYTMANHYAKLAKARYDKYKSLCDAPPVE